jgi:hypothetical protein
MMGRRPLPDRIEKAAEVTPAAFFFSPHHRAEQSQQIRVESVTTIASRTSSQLRGYFLLNVFLPTEVYETGKANNLER